MKSVYFLTVHKGASTFISSTLAPRLARELGLAHVLVDHERIRKSHEEVMPHDFPYHETGHLYSRLYPGVAGHIDFRDRTAVALVRDPRDVAVSWYFSLAYSHPPLPGRHGERLREQRTWLRALSVRQGVKELALTAIDEFEKFHRIADAHPNILVTRYEDMVTDFPRWFDAVADHLDLGLTRGDYYSLQSEFVVERENVHEHKRRVTPGNWKEVFDGELRDIFEKRIARSMQACDYGW